MLETPSERTASEAVESSVSPEVEVVMLSPSMQLRMRAAQLLREKGWCQGVSRDSENRFCVLGALAIADGWDGATHFVGSDLYYAAQEDLVSASGFHRPEELALRWNDSPSRTKEQVIALLEGRDWEAVEGDEANERRGAAAPSAQSAGLGPTDGDGS